jgi:hypothetical protein
VDMWQAPIDTLSKAGRAMEGIEALLGGAAGGTFDLQVPSSFQICAVDAVMRMEDHPCCGPTMTPSCAA